MPWPGRPPTAGARFVPGFSSAAVTVALSRISTAKFLVLNAVGALAWALTFGVLGYLFGQAVEALLGDIERYEKPVALLIAAATWIIWRHSLYVRFTRRKAA